MRASFVGISLMLIALSACETGFGQPCSLPNSPEMNSACEPPPSTGVTQEGAEGTEQSYKVTCAIDNYPTCETMSCLVYRGSSAYCSQRCAADSDCFGSGVCCPLFGECNATLAPTGGAEAMSVEAPANDCGQPGNPCYCVRKGDLSR
mgnify:CR=1 FL=1